MDSSSLPLCDNSHKNIDPNKAIVFIAALFGAHEISENYTPTKKEQAAIAGLKWCLGLCTEMKSLYLCE